MHRIFCVHLSLKIQFSVSMENGSVSIYKKNFRQWNLKSKVKAISIVSIDSKDGYPGVVFGWEDGKIEVYFFFII